MRPACPALLFLLLPGCTMQLWDQGWEVERVHHVAIDAARVDVNEVLRVRVTRDHGDPVAYSVPLAQALRRERDQRTTVQIVDEDRMERVRSGLEPDPAPGSRQVLVALHTGGPGELLLVHDSRIPARVSEFDLPDPPIAWGSANFIGHVALTPVTLAVDVVLLPFYAVVFVLYVTGAIHGT